MVSKLKKSRTAGACPGRAITDDEGGAPMGAEAMLSTKYLRNSRLIFAERSVLFFFVSIIWEQGLDDGYWKSQGSFHDT